VSGGIITAPNNDDYYTVIKIMSFEVSSQNHLAFLRNAYVRM
jgi:hypothetical protein